MLLGKDMDEQMSSKRRMVSDVGIIDRLGYMTDVDARCRPENAGQRRRDDLRAARVHVVRHADVDARCRPGRAGQGRRDHRAARVHVARDADALANDAGPSSC